MADNVSPETRSRMLAAVRGKDTKLELVVRRALHARGLRFRVNDPRYPGSPDLVFPSRRAMIFVHGCFWHGHDCHLHVTPGTRTEFWTAKFAANRQRDARVERELSGMGWRVAVVWECALRGQDEETVIEVLKDLEAWVREGGGDLVLRG